MNLYFLPFPHRKHLVEAMLEQGPCGAYPPVAFYVSTAARGERWMVGWQDWDARVLGDPQALVLAHRGEVMVAGFSLLLRLLAEDVFREHRANLGEGPLWLRRPGAAGGDLAGWCLWHGVSSQSEHGVWASQTRLFGVYEIPRLLQIPPTSNDMQAAFALGIVASHVGLGTLEVES